jgi:hypothetical protein
MYVSVMNWNESKTEHGKLALERSNAVFVMSTELLTPSNLCMSLRCPYRNPYGLIIGLG